MAVANNVLWDGSTCRFIDFEEFGVSDLAYEIADLLEHASHGYRDWSTLTPCWSYSRSARPNTGEWPPIGSCSRRTGS